MELYDWLLLIHILAAIAWVGGATTINILATRIRRAGTPEDLVAFTGLAEWIGPRVYSLASLVVLAWGPGWWPSATPGPSDSCGSCWP